MTTRFSTTERDAHIATENGEEVPVYNEDDRREFNAQGMPIYTDEERAEAGRVGDIPFIPGVFGPPQEAFPLRVVLVEDDDENMDEDDDWQYDDDEDDDEELDFDTYGDGGNGWTDEI